MKKILSELKGWLFTAPDHLSGIILFIVALFTILEALHLPFGKLHAPDAGFFPLCLSVLLLIISVGIVLRPYSNRAKVSEFNTRSWYVIATAAAFVLYALFIQTLGFVILTAVILLLLMRALGGISWKRALTIAISGAIIAYIGFWELGVPLPTGILPY